MNHMSVNTPLKLMMDQTPIVWIRLHETDEISHFGDQDQDEMV